MLLRAASVLLRALRWYLGHRAQLAAALGAVHTAIEAVDAAIDRVRAVKVAARP